MKNEEAIKELEWVKEHGFVAYKGITGNRKKAGYILSGETWKDFVFACDHYTTEPRQMEIYEIVRR